MANFLGDSDSDDEWDRRQQEFNHPWDHSRPAKPGHGRDAALADPNSDEWQRRGYTFDEVGSEEAKKVTAKFRADVRSVYSRGTYADGSTGVDRYGGTPAVRAQVGHVFSHANGGANTRDNIFMQESGYNMTIHDDHDELNAAMVGKSKTAGAMKDSRAHGHLNTGRWAGWEPEEVRQHGKEQWKSVGVLTKNEGGIDKRCTAVRRQEVQVDKYGMAHGLDNKVREIRRNEKR